MTASDEVYGFAVARVDRRGELSLTYLRSFALAGRNGLHRLAFGELAAAHIFESRTEAEDIARRLRRRISGTHYDYRVEEVSQGGRSIPVRGKADVGGVSQ